LDGGKKGKGKWENGKEQRAVVILGLCEYIILKKMKISSPVLLETGPRVDTKIKMENNNK
jgi:hypothetical protein